jgi:hypothetical protein
MASGSRIVPVVILGGGLGIRPVGLAAVYRITLSDLMSDPDTT